MKRILFLFLAAVFISSFVSAEGPFKAGDNATDFSLKNVNGKTVSLSDLSDAKGFIVVFTSNVCPVAKKYEGRIVELNREFAPKGYPVVAINSNDAGVSPGDSYEEMKRVANEKGYTFLYLRDEEQNVAKLYGATNTPHVYLLSRDGNNLKVQYTGAIDNNADDAGKADKRYVADAVNALLAGSDVSVKSTKAVGCSLKWKKSE